MVTVLLLLTGRAYRLFTVTQLAEARRSESDVQWEQLQRQMTRALRIRDMDFTDLTVSDDDDILDSPADAGGGGPPPPPPPPPGMPLPGLAQGQGCSPTNLALTSSLGCTIDSFPPLASSIASPESG